MNCLKCERVLTLLPPVEHECLDGGGHVTVEFGYGSTHDMDTAEAFVCDDCYDRFRHLFRVTKSLFNPVGFNPISVVPPPPPPPDADLPVEVRS